MEETKFYKNVWRFNALVIALAGVLATILLLFATYTIYKDASRNRQRNEIVNIDPKTNIEEVFRLGRVKHITGSKAVIVPLYSDQKFSLNYSASKSTASTRNILFSNMGDETNKWLLSDNKFLIVNHKLISEGHSYDKTREVVVILYNIIKSDTNHDSRLTKNDKVTVSLSDPEGNSYAEVIKNTDTVLGAELLDKEAIAIMHTRDNKGYTTYVNLLTFKVIKEIALPKIN